MWTFDYYTVLSLTSMYNLALTSMNRNEARGGTYFCYPEMYVDGDLNKKNEKFIKYVKTKQRHMKQHRESIQNKWTDVKKNSEYCSKLIIDVAKAMYFLRFFLRGHEGTPKFKIMYSHGNGRTGDVPYTLSREATVDREGLEITIVGSMKKKLNTGMLDKVTRAYLVTEPAGRLPEGDLLFSEVPQTTGGNLIFEELCQSTQEMFKPKKEHKADKKTLKQTLHCPTALGFAEQINAGIADPLKNSTMVHITKWLLILGSALDAYGDLDKVITDSELWTKVKAKIQKGSHERKPQAKGSKTHSSGWTCS
jgi:hypothetical protein